jgi:hypothetical protein
MLGSVSLSGLGFHPELLPIPQAGCARSLCHASLALLNERLETGKVALRSAKVARDDRLKAQHQHMKVQATESLPTLRACRHLAFVCNDQFEYDIQLKTLAKFL